MMGGRPVKVRLRQSSNDPICLRSKTSFSKTIFYILTNIFEQGMFLLKSFKKEWTFLVLIQLKCFA